MKVIILGGTGFIGRALCVALLKQGHDVVVVTRNPALAMEPLSQIIPEEAEGGLWVAAWDGEDYWAKDADGADVVVNLAGKGIADGRWTPTNKAAILESRINSTRAVYLALKQAEKRPEVLIQASAVGYYGPRAEGILIETSGPGNGFLAETARMWEEASEAVEELGVRRVVIRTGMVLGMDGALPKMAKPFRFYLGGPLGSGNQWVSWIHIMDHVLAVLHLIRNKDAKGVYNLTSPHPVRMKDFCRALGEALNRPSWLPAPEAVLKLLLGQMAEELLLSGQQAVPARLVEEGFSFAYPEIGQALHDLLS